MRAWEGWKGRSPDIAITASLAAAVLLAFSPALRNGFVNFDDPMYITANPVTQQGLSVSTVAWAFTTGSAANWHPLTWLSVMWDVDLFGLNPSGHHAMSLGIHALNTVLVFAFMRRLGIGRGPSAFAAGLFGLHPLHVESVAWAAERKDVLSMAFGLCTLLAYLRYAEAPSRGRMVGVTVLLALGLMAKPMLVTLPFVLLLLDWWPLRRVGSPACLASPRAAPGEALSVTRGKTREGTQTKGGGPSPKERHAKGRHDRGRPGGRHASGRTFDGDGVGRGTAGQDLLLEKAPLFAVVLLSCAVTYLVQKAGGVVFGHVPVAFRLENAPHSYVIYLQKFVFPSRLACFYPITELAADGVALSVAALLAISFLAWRFRTTHPYVLVGWLWFVGSLVPMIGLVQVGGQSYADRYTYFPSLGLGLAASLGLAEAVGRARLPRAVVTFAGCALLAVLGVATWRQTLVWRDTVGLFEHAVAATERNTFVRLLLADEFIKNNEFERARATVDQSLADGAAPHAGQMLAVDLFMRIQAALSAYFDREHREEEALREIDRALVVQPDDWQMLASRGFYLMKLQRDAEAVAVLERAIALNTGNNPKQLELAHRALAIAQRRLAGETGPAGAPAAPR